MSSPTISASGNVQLTASGSMTQVVSSIANNEVYLVNINTTPTVNPLAVYTIASIAGGGLTWRPFKVISYLSAPGQFGVNTISTNFWGASNTTGATIVTPTLTITPTSPAPNNGVAMQWMTVAGTQNPLTPVDPGGGIFSNQAQGNFNVTFSTLNADDLLILFVCQNSPSGLAAHPPSGWTDLAGPAQGPDSYIATKSVSATQTNVTVASNVRSDSGGIGVVVALTGDAGGVTLVGCGPTIPLPT